MKNLLALAFLLIVAGFGMWFINNNRSSFEDIDTTILQSEDTVDIQKAGESIIGLWQSTQDEKSFRDFKASGEVVDIYDSEELGSGGVWRIYTAEDVLKAGFPFVIEGELVYLEIVLEDDSLHFSIIENTEQKLVLSYLDRGNILEYRRAPSPSL